MKKNILSLLLSFLVPPLLFGAAEETDLSFLFDTAEEADFPSKKNISFSPKKQSVSVFSVNFSQEDFLQNQTGAFIPYINFSESSTLCIKNEFFRILLTYDKLGPKVSAFKKIIKTFNILILYKEDSKVNYAFTNKERLSTLMPNLQFIIVFSKKDKAFLARKIQIDEDIAPCLHAYADVNFNIFPLEVESKTLKQIIQKWPIDKKYDETSLDFFKTEEERAKEKEEKKEIAARREKERFEREEMRKKEKEIRKEKEQKEAKEKMIHATKKKKKRRCLDLIEN